MKKKITSLVSVVLSGLMVVGGISVSATSEKSQLILGDTNLDGVVTISDATVIQKNLAGLVDIEDESLVTGDVDSSGIIDIYDALEIQRYTVRNSTIPNIGNPIESKEETTTESKTENTTVSTTESTTQSATIGDGEDAWKSNTGKIILGSTIQVTGVGASVEGNKVIISEGGDWEVTGSLDNGMIYVNTSEEKNANDKVKLRLNGMSLTNQNGPAIYFDICKKAFITIEDGSVNTVCDSTSYSTENGEAKGTIHSDDTLEIKGKGTLNVTSSYKHGINSDDDILIENGVINIKSATDGLHANDNITVNGKNVKLNINSTSDAMESDGDLSFVLGSAVVNSKGKGIKSTADINISGGIFDITSVDDSVHSNANINITAGDFTISSDDDGIHADTALNVSGGNINVKKSYEGLEANEITISGGTIYAKASDDGINAAGGNDGSSMGGRPGQNNFRPSPGSSSTSNAFIKFDGGYTFVDVKGDGIDANGAIYFNGGTAIAVGPSSGGNNCIDCDSGATYTGGTVIGIASSNAMWNDITGKVSGITPIYKTSAGSVQSGSTIAVTDSNSNVLSIVKPSISGNLGIIYMTDKVSSLSSCKFVLGGSYSGTFDSFGYGEGGTISGGTSVTPQTGSS